MVFQGCWTALKMDKDDPYLIRRGSILRVHRYPPYAKAFIWEDSGNSQIAISFNAPFCFSPISSAPQIFRKIPPTS